MSPASRTHYVAFLRSINAGIRVKMADLRQIFIDLGYDDVATVLATGNVLFRTGQRADTRLADEIETAMLRALDARTSAIVYTVAELRALVDGNPFGDFVDEAATRLHVTFLKHPPEHDLAPLLEGATRGYSFVGHTGRAIFSVVDLTAAKTPDLMAKLEKEFGKEITTRGWRTVQKVFSTT